MDDFDHSIHIAEDDWSSFFDESEECDLLQPSLACPDDSDLSDPEESGQQESQMSPGAEESCTGCTNSPKRLNQSVSRGAEKDSATCTKELEICVSCPERNTITVESLHKETEQNSTYTTQTKPRDCFHSGESKRLTKDGNVQTSDHKPAADSELLFYSPADLSMNELDASERVSDTGAQKERWFVTIDDNLARRQRRGRSASLKKKLKQKKACEGGHEGILSQQESSAENGTKQEPGEYQSGDLSHGSGGLQEKSLEHIKYHNLEGHAELFSGDFCDSQSCLAAETMKEAQHPPPESPYLQCSLSLTCDSSTKDAEAGQVQDEQMSSQFAVAAANCNCYEITSVEPSIACPSAADSPDDDSTCDYNSSSETSGPQTALSCNVCSQEDYLSSLPAPDPPCFLLDSPETYAKAAGNTKPVFAISAFWDDMEKLTINDILQVRKGRISHPKLIEEVEPDPINSQGDAVEYHLSDSGLTYTSDAADSDYFTQPDDSKPDRCSCEFLNSDGEEDCWPFVGASANPSPDLYHNNQQSASSFLAHEDGSKSSDGRETPVLLEDVLGCFGNQGQSIHDAPNTEDLCLLPLHRSDESFLCLHDLNPNNYLEALIPACFSSHVDVLDAHYQTSNPEIPVCVFRESKSQSLTAYDPRKIFVDLNFNSTLCREIAPSSTDKPIPIFSCSHPTIGEFTFPKPLRVFLREDEISPIRLVSRSFIQANPHATGKCWKTLLSMRRISFPDKGSICCRGYSVWMLPAETEENPMVSEIREGKVGPDSSQEFTELEEKLEGLENVSMIKRNGIFSTVKQSDMCLVCIAFASWVLRSSDPEATDAWKAALLANVSALSAIQYLRQSTRRKNPFQHQL
nr:uncharacterized protein LOC107385148 [Nothobranchius furzeri]